MEELGGPRVLPAGPRAPGSGLLLPTAATTFRLQAASSFLIHRSPGRTPRPHQMQLQPEHCFGNRPQLPLPGGAPDLAPLPSTPPSTGPRTRGERHPPAPPPCASEPCPPPAGGHPRAALTVVVLRTVTNAKHRDGSGALPATSRTLTLMGSCEDVSPKPCTIPSWEAVPVLRTYRSRIRPPPGSPPPLHLVPLQKPGRDPP